VSFSIQFDFQKNSLFGQLRNQSPNFRQKFFETLK
jgi:hypothetical protein